MIVVSDTGPVSYLVAIKVIDCLPQLYGEVYIPTAVLAELRHEDSPAHLWASNPPSWLKSQDPAVLTQYPELDEADSHAIALALELNAEQLLMDERKGRRVAKDQNLAVVGTLAVIVDGHRQGLFDGHLTLDRLSKQIFTCRNCCWSRCEGYLPNRLGRPTTPSPPQSLHTTAPHSSP